MSSGCMNRAHISPSKPGPPPFPCQEASQIFRAKNLLAKIFRRQVFRPEKGETISGAALSKIFSVNSAGRRAISDGFYRGNGADSDSVGYPNDGNGKREHGSGKKSGPLISGTAYCISSCGMILLNKIVLSTYNFNAGISLMFYQNLISCLIVAALSFCGVVSVEKLNWKLVRVWIPVNVVFVGMLVSGMYSLKYINIAMVTILKNGTNIITAIGELYIFRKHQNQKVWTAMFLMIISAISGGITDLSFDSMGYTWQIMNCFLTASYSPVDLLGLAISFTSMWFLHQTGPTTYSLVGSLNKIPISFAGLVLFKVPLSLPNFFSILFGLFAGIFFARAKMS
ncbi:hypothetical protein OIU78_008018 [Salix suchowensis]|nr:hypothetical protein OIU78_008018 [Salix suchowensis]